MKQFMMIVLAGLLIIGLSSCGVPKSEVEKLNTQITQLQTEKKQWEEVDKPKLKQEISTLSNQVAELKKRLANQVSSVVLEELAKLSDLKEIDIRDLEALEDIFNLLADPRWEKSLDLMLGEGIPNKRKYSTPLEALLWLAYDKEFTEDYNPLKYYTLERLIIEAWRGSTTSNNYQSDKWKIFEEVTNRLNSPKLVEIYLQANFTYSYTPYEPQGVKSAEEIFNTKTGACYDNALFAAYCLKKNGYEAWALHLRYKERRGFFIGHVVALYKDPKNSLYYTIDTPGKRTRLYGPFKTIEEAAEHSSWGQGVRAFVLHEINLETKKYQKTPLPSP